MGHCIHVNMSTYVKSNLVTYFSYMVSLVIQKLEEL